MIVLGRRGPAQAAFTTPELRELGELTRADIIVDPADMELDEPARPGWPPTGDATSKRNVDLLRDYAQREPHGHARKVELRFLRSPVEILGEGEDGPVTGIRIVERTGSSDGRAPSPTGEEEVIACGLVLRSIGYRGVPLAGHPVRRAPRADPQRGGRVIGEDGEHERGEYVVGWVKRGPSGVIGTNKKDAADTLAKILEDREAGALNEPDDPTPRLARSCCRALPGAGHLGGLAAIDEPRDRARRAAEPPARQARAHGRDARRGQRHGPALNDTGRRRALRRTGASVGTPRNPRPRLWARRYSPKADCTIAIGQDLIRPMSQTVRRAGDRVPRQRAARARRAP